MKIYRLQELSERLIEAFTRLLPQLSQSAEIPTAKYVEELFYDKNTHLIVAEEDDCIVGMLTLVVVNIPTGRKAWIEDVVIDGDYRGRNIGFQLVEESKKLATTLGVKKIYLTSNPSRRAAHALYAKCGFEEYDTTVFRIKC